MSTIGSNTTPAFFQKNLTSYGTLYPDANGVFTNVVPSATSGIALVSNGAAAGPTHSTVIVAGGGTGVTSTTAYGLIAGGTTTTNPFQNGGTGSTGQWYVSNGSSSLGTWKSLSVVVQVFTGAGTYTYTPTSGMVYCFAQCVGAGGGGGATTTCDATRISAGGGGGAGGYSQKVITSATIGGSQTITIGTGGTAGATSGGTGGTGGTSSVGAIISSTGGTGGTGAGASSSAQAVNGGNGGVGSSGDFVLTGMRGDSGLSVMNVNPFCYSGRGGASYLGSGAAPIVLNTSQTAGLAGQNYGSGGSGGSTAPSGTGVAGGAGSDGIVVITEYVIS